MSALLLTVIAALPMSISMQDMMRADVYWGPPRAGFKKHHCRDLMEYSDANPGAVEVGAAGCTQGDDCMHGMSSAMTRKFTDAFNLVAICLFFSLFVSLSLSALPEHSDDDGPEKLKTADRRARHASLSRWWSWLRLLVGIAAVCLVVGGVVMMMGVQVMLYLKVPNYLAARRCEEAGWRFNRIDPITGAGLYVNGTFIERATDLERFKNPRDDPTGYNKLIGQYVLVPMLVLGLSFAGYGNARADQVYRHEKELDDEEQASGFN